MGSSKIIVASVGVAIVSVMLVQTVGPSIISATSNVDFHVSVPDEIFSVGQSVHFSITGIAGGFLKFVWFFHDATGGNTTTDGSTTSIYHSFSTEGQYLVGVYGFTTTNYGYPIDVLRTVQVTVRNSLPSMTIDSNSTSVFESKSIHFSVSSFTDPGVDTSKTSYVWNFGDGTNVTGRTINHAYANSGKYNVLVYGTDTLGQVAIANTSINVSGQAPVIHVSMNSTTILEGQTIQFDASHTTAGPAELTSLTYGWNFGDGVYGSGSIVTETYEHPGSYTSILTVTDQLGASVSQTIPIQVLNIAPQITSMALDHRNITVGQTVVGQAQAIDSASDTPRLTYNWILDKSSSTGQVTTFTPFQPESTTAYLNVTDTSSVTTSSSQPLKVLNVPPRASLIGVQMNFNLTVTITGDKWKAIDIQLLNENNLTVINDTLVRQAGNPWTMALNFPNVNLDLSHIWRFVTYYTPNSTATNGADPVSLYLNLTNGNNVYSVTYNHTFNVQQPTWYTWVQPLDPFTTNLPIGWIVNYFDPGTTTLNIKLDNNDTKGATIPAVREGPQSGIVLFYANIYANESIPIDLTVTDQYSLSSTTSYSVDAPLNSAQGYRLTLLAPTISSINTTTILQQNSDIHYFGSEETNYVFNVSSQPFYGSSSSLLYIWLFGDGTNVTTASNSINHLFTYAGLYEVSVKIINTLTHYSTTQGILVQILPQAPTIQFSFASSQTASVGKPVNFDASMTSAVYSEQSVIYYWRFNTSSSIEYTGYSAQLTRTFYHSGIYTGTLFAVGKEGIISNESFDIWVQDYAPSVTLSDTYTAFEGQNVFISPQVTDSNIQIPFLQYYWHVGSSVFSQKSINLFFKSGIYNTFLIVKDSEGIFSNTSVEISICTQVPKINPIIQFFYGHKQQYRLELSAQMSNLDLGTLMYKTIPGSWHQLSSNSISTSIDLSSYQDGINFINISLKDSKGAIFLQSIPLSVFGDSNGDNILDKVKQQHNPRLNPTSADFDGDGISDYTEITGWYINVIPAGQKYSIREYVTSDPAKLKTNGCMLDNTTYRLGGNPYALDGSTAQDGIKDCSKYQYGLPLTVAINPTTTMTGQMFINSTTNSNNKVWRLNVNVKEVVTGNPVLSFDKNSHGYLFPSQNTIYFYNSSYDYLGSCNLDNSGSCTLTYKNYQDSIKAYYYGNNLYAGTSLNITPDYHVQQMIQNQGPTGISPVTNAKFTIIKQYVEHSGAFDHNSNTGTYTMNSYDDCNLFKKGGPSPGYCIYNPAPSVSQQELDSNQFNSGLIPIQRFYLLKGDLHDDVISITKMQFFNLWLGMKLAPYYTGDVPPLPSSYTELDSLARNFSTVLSEPSSYFKSGGSTEKNFVAGVRGEINASTKLGFPKPVSTSWLQGLINLVNSVISAFIGLVEAVWQDIINILGSIANFVMGVWNYIVGSILGPVIEIVKNIVTITINYFINIVSSTFTSSVNSPLSSTFREGIVYFRNHVDQSLTQIPNIFPTDLSIISNSLNSFGDVLTPIKQISSILDVFNFPLIDQLKSLIPANLVINTITTLFQDLLNSLATNILVSLNFNTVYSDIQSTGYSSTELNNLMSISTNVNPSSSTINSNDKNPNSIFKSFNIGQLSSTTQWFNSHNLETRFNSNYRSGNSILANMAINLESVLSSTLYQLLTGFSKDPSNEINTMVNIGTVVQDKDIYTSLLLSTSIASRFFNWYGEQIEQDQSLMNNFLNKGGPLNLGGISISLKSVLKIIAKSLAIYHEFIGDSISEVIVEEFGSVYDFLPKNFILSIFNAIGEIIQTISAIWHDANKNSLNAYRLWGLGVAVSLAAVFYSGGFALLKVINNPSIVSKIGSVFLLSSSIATLILLLNMVQVLSRQYLDSTNNINDSEKGFLDNLINKLPYTILKTRENFSFILLSILDIAQIYTFRLS